MDTGRRHKTPRSETKNFITRGYSNRQCQHLSQFPKGDTREPGYNRTCSGLCYRKEVMNLKRIRIFYNRHKHACPLLWRVMLSLQHWTLKRHGLGGNTTFIMLDSRQTCSSAMEINNVFIFQSHLLN